MATATITTNGTAPKITLWTDHDCPWAHRLEIAMKELKLAYEEVLVDLTKPREDWYLKINPRGQVPALHYSNGIIDETLTESAIIAQFLVDAHPSHLLPASNSSPTAPLFRARVNFLVDTYFTKVNPLMFALMRLSSEEERAQKSDELVRAVERELEPFLKDADPFFGGSKDITFAEVQCAPFVLRLYDLSDGVILPTYLPASLDKLPVFAKWAMACRMHGSVLDKWDAELRRRRGKESLARYRARAAAAQAIATEPSVPHTLGRK